MVNACAIRLKLEGFSRTDKNLFFGRLYKIREEYLSDKDKSNPRYMEENWQI